MFIPIVTDEDLGFHIRRYCKYDVSDKANEGIPKQTVVEFPEFAGHPFANRIIEIFTSDKERLDGDTEKPYYYPSSQAKSKDRIYLDQFLYMCAALHLKAPYSIKKSC